MFKKAMFGALAVLFMSQLTGCIGYKTASVTIDNDLESPITITVDGVELGTLRGNKSKKFDVAFGERKFLVTSQGRVIYEGVKAIEAARAPLMLNQYLLNPSGRAQYCSCRVEYIPLGEKAEKNSEFDDQRRSLSKGNWIPVPENTYVLVEPDHLKFGPDDADVFQIYRPREKRSTASKRSKNSTIQLNLNDEPAPVPVTHSNPFAKQVSTKKDVDVPVSQGPFSTKGNPFFNDSKSK